MAYIVLHTEKFNRILNFLREELGLPDTVIGFELHMRNDDVLRITKMDYLPMVKKEEENIIDVTKLDSR
jgi:hypothetical protein